MTRRILFVLLGFTAVVLVGAVVPLTLNAASHDRSSFIEATAATVRTDAAVAQARLDYLYSISHGKQGSGPAATGPTDPPLVNVLTQVRQTGDGLLIMTSPDNKLAANVGMPRGDWTRLADPDGSS